MVAAVVCMLAAWFATAQNSSVKDQLAAKEQRLENLYAEYWRADYEVQQGKAGSSTQAVEEQIRAVISDPAFQRALEAARFTDPVDLRRRQLFLDEAGADEVANDPGLSALVQSIRDEESATRYKVGDRALTRGEVNNIIGHEPDRRLRQQAWEARAQVTEKVGEQVRQVMKLRNQLSLRFSKRPFPDAALARKGLTRARITYWFEQIRAGSDPDYHRLVERMRRELRVTKVEPWDLEYYFSTLSRASEDKFFEREQAWPKIKRLALSLGYDFDRLPVQVKIADITFGGSTYPIFYGREVRILVNKYAGLRFTDTLLHEAGHALHYCFDDQGSFLLRNNYSEPFDEGLGQVMSLMLYRPEVAKEYFGLTSDQAGSIIERYRLKSLFDLRELMADFLFELAAYDQPDQNLAELYNQNYSRLLGVEMHRRAVWAFDPFYASQPIYEHNYVLAEMFGRQVHHALEQRFGRRWGPEAGRYIRDKFFSQGARYTLDELLVRGTGEPLTAKYLIESWRVH